ncbi:MAG: hypothetical protein LCH86_09560 [Proteobacteria bacterium]|nr:hypothetical protein [Pseudomonadota bacterium]
MQDYGTYRQADLASKARAAENKSMGDLAREKALATIRSAEAGVVDPYNRLVGGGPRNYADLTNMTVREVIDLASGLKAQGHMSNVAGGFQFKNTTLASVAKDLGILDQKFTPDLQDKVAQELMQRRADRATIDGKVDVDTFAKELAKEWASLATKDGKSYYDKNGIDKAGVDYATVRGIAKDLVDHGVVTARSGGRSTSPDLPSNVASLPSSRPTSFDDKYLGGSKSNGGLSPKQIGDYREYANVRSYAPVDPVTRVAEAPQAAQSARPPAPTPSRAGRPADASPTQPSAPAKSKELTTGQQILAGGIDVLGGMVPGLGTGLSIANAGLKLTGNRTVGEMIVNDMVNGSGRNGSAIMASAGSDRSVTRKKPEPAKVSVQPADSFIDKYVAFVDPVKRPTPAQKWSSESQYGQV